MKMAKEVSLHPELVRDVVDELLEMEIISKKQIHNLKKDNDLKIDDPNVKMDLRHEIVKIEQKAARKVMRTRNTLNRRLTTIQDSKVKQLKVIDQEIHKFVKKLKFEHKQVLLSQNKSLTSGKEDCRPLINNYVQHTSSVSEQQLEINKFKKSFDLNEFGNIRLTPEPIELKGRRVSSAPTPICQTVLKTNGNNCSFLTLERPPNNTPIEFKKLCDGSCPLSICVAKKMQDISALNREKSIIIKVHNKWKAYIIKNRENKIKTECENKIILKKYFNKWSQYCKKQEVERSTQRLLKQSENEKKIHVLFNGLLEKQKQVLVCKVTPGEDLLKRKTEPKQSEQCSKLKTKRDRYVNQTDNCSVINDDTVNKEGTLSNTRENKLVGPANTRVTNCDVVIKQNKNLQNRTESMQKKIRQQTEVIDKQKEQIKHQTQQLEQFQIKLLHISAKYDEAKATERLKQCKLQTKGRKEEITMKSLIQKKEEETESNTRAKLIIQRMEERAEECRKRNLLAKERKEQKEKEKIKREQELEEQKLKEQQEIKKKKIQEKKEQIKLERLDQLQKYLETQREKQLMSLASNHYYKTLLKKAFKGFRMIIHEREVLSNQSKNFYDKKLIKNYFKLWERNASDLALKKEKMAVNLYNKNLLIKCWKCWIRYYDDYVRKCQVSTDWYYMKVQERAFQWWCIFTDQEIINTEEKMEVAKTHYEKYLMKLAFKQWKQLPAVMFLEREREKRIHSWRERVQEMLPDYCPVIPEEFEI